MISTTAIRLTTTATKTLLLRRTRLLSTAVIPEITTSLRDPNPELVDARQAPPDYVSSSAVVYRDFVSEHEADTLVQDLQNCMKRRRYEKGHWDAVIVNYKETELLDEKTLLSPESVSLLDRVRHQLTERHMIHRRQDNFTWLPCHAIDLHKTGELNAHVDSVRFSGDIVAGLSLLSPSIMRLRPDDDGDVQTGLVEHCNMVPWVDLYLPPRSLYVLADASRYHYSHQLLPSGSVFWEDGSEPITVERDHRLSVIFRDAKAEE